MDKSSLGSEVANALSRPLPDDFIPFLPWACSQLGCEQHIVITKAYQIKYEHGGSHTERNKQRTKSKGKVAISRTEESERDDKGVTEPLGPSEVVNVVAVYDNNEDLVQIKFEKCNKIPCLIFKIMDLIIKFYPQLSSISISEGLNVHTLYELGKLLPASNITEVCLDGCFLKECNYDILLENETSLRHLSLSRCKIDDNILENIANKLTFPCPGSKSLSLLNLSSNRITDTGAKHIARVLRANRSLTYINVAGNTLTDEGAVEILNVLKEFEITNDELLSSKTRYIAYLRMKNESIARTVQELKAGGASKALGKKKPGRPVTSGSGRKTKATDKDPSLHSIVDVENVENAEAVLYERAAAIARSSFGEFSDAFSSENITVRDNIVYCLGNNVMCYLNFAYNNLGFKSLKTLLEVLRFQKSLANRKPRGLIRVCIEGNALPDVCDELKQIEVVLERNLHEQRSTILGKKRPQSKSSAR